jgi:hypothetical protein
MGILDVQHFRSSKYLYSIDLSEIFVTFYGFVDFTLLLSDFCAKEKMLEILSRKVDYVDICSLFCSSSYDSALAFDCYSLFSTPTILIDGLITIISLVAFTSG